MQAPTHANNRLSHWLLIGNAVAGKKCRSPLPCRRLASEAINKTDHGLNTLAWRTTETAYATKPIRALFFLGFFYPFAFVSDADVFNMYNTHTHTCVLMYSYTLKMAFGISSCGCLPVTRHVSRSVKSSVPWSARKRTIFTQQTHSEHLESHDQRFLEICD